MSRKNAVLLTVVMVMVTMLLVFPGEARAEGEFDEVVYLPFLRKETGPWIAIDPFVVQIDGVQSAEGQPASEAVLNTICGDELSPMTAARAALANSLCLLPGKFPGVGIQYSERYGDGGFAMAGQNNGSDAVWDFGDPLFEAGATSILDSPHSPYVEVFQLEDWVASTATGPTVFESGEELVAFQFTINPVKFTEIVTGQSLVAADANGVSEIAPVTLAELVKFMESLGGFIKYFSPSSYPIGLDAFHPIYDVTGITAKTPFNCGTPAGETEVIWVSGPIGLGLARGIPSPMVHVTFIGPPRTPGHQTFQDCMLPHRWLRLTSLMTMREAESYRQSMEENGYGGWRDSFSFGWYQPQPEVAYSVAATTTVGGATLYVIAQTVQGVVQTATAVLIVPTNALECFILGDAYTCSISGME